MTTKEIGHKQVHDFCKMHFNEPVLLGMTVGRLIGYGETAVDCYYIAHEMGGGIIWHTAVGPCMTLRALQDQDKVIPLDPSNGTEWNNFTRLDSWLALNGAPRAEAFVCEIRPDDHEGMKP